MKITLCIGSTQNSCKDIRKPFLSAAYVGHMHISLLSVSANNVFQNSNGYHIKMQELNYPFVTNL
jgi:hypothetical protein